MSAWLAATGIGGLMNAMAEQIRRRKIREIVHFSKFPTLRFPHFAGDAQRRTPSTMLEWSELELDPLPGDSTPIRLKFQTPNAPPRRWQTLMR